MSEFIKVPSEELQKLEDCRINIYEFLEKKLTKKEISDFSLLTHQIWQVANTKKWSVE